MKAIIIAAGQGKRLRGISGDIPKPLIPIGNVPLLERIIGICRDSGVGDFGMVVGYKHNSLEDYFGDGSKFGVNIEYVFNPEWEKGNGVSAYIASEMVRGEESFLLMMSDHLINRDIINRLLKDDSSCNLLAVDRDIERIFDLDDATKVLCEGDNIMEIGKEIPHYNGLDCGIFRLKSNFFGAMGEALASGSDQLSDGVRVLINRRDFKAHFISTDAHWLDVDTEEAFRFAEGNLELYC
ncbi:MAG: NTP transferase domain-containing protein [candidate division Zixibacteria bacterium]|nr:NTP transferase domain-containing protein [Candidatus Tariuqbacter arcticus]